MSAWAATGLFVRAAPLLGALAGYPTLAAALAFVLVVAMVPGVVANDTPHLTRSEPVIGQQKRARCRPRALRWCREDARDPLAVESPYGVDLPRSLHP